MTSNILRKPPWIRLRRTEGPDFTRVRRILRARGLGTVCEEARCPNRSECWSCGTATFLILGQSCTRSCRFCSVETVKEGEKPDETEPDRVAEAVVELGLKVAVLTSVSRDDLPDGGANHYARTIGTIHEKCPTVGVEALIPDYLGDDLRAVLEAKPHVLAHNVEVVRDLSAKIRDRRCNYDRSLAVLEEARRLSPKLTTKSSLLLGLGESSEQIGETLDDLRAVGVSTLCIGQYLQPTSSNVPVVRYVTPDEFEALEQLARSKGFRNVLSGPLVRTSYRAAELINGDGVSGA